MRKNGDISPLSFLIAFTATRIIQRFVPSIQNIGIATARSIEIVPQNGVGLPLEFSNIQPPKRDSTSIIHHPKGIRL